MKSPAEHAVAWLTDRSETCFLMCRQEESRTRSSWMTGGGAAVGPPTPRVGTRLSGLAFRLHRAVLTIPAVTRAPHVRLGRRRCSPGQGDAATAGKMRSAEADCRTTDTGVVAAGISPGPATAGSGKTTICQASFAAGLGHPATSSSTPYFISGNWQPLATSEFGGLFSEFTARRRPGSSMANYLPRSATIVWGPAPNTVVLGRRAAPPGHAPRWSPRHASAGWPREPSLWKRKTGSRGGTCSGLIPSSPILLWALDRNHRRYPGQVPGRAGPIQRTRT